MKISASWLRTIVECANEVATEMAETDRPDMLNIELVANESWLTVHIEVVHTHCLYADTKRFQFANGTIVNSLGVR